MVRMRDLMGMTKSCLIFGSETAKYSAIIVRMIADFPLWYRKSCRKRRSGLFFAPLPGSGREFLRRERWPSGLRYTPGKRAYGFNRTEGSNPSLSATNHNLLNSGVCFLEFSINEKAGYRTLFSNQLIQFLQKLIATLPGSSTERKAYAATLLLFQYAGQEQKQRHQQHNPEQNSPVSAGIFARSRAVHNNRQTAGLTDDDHAWIIAC